MNIKDAFNIVDPVLEARIEEMEKWNYYQSLLEDKGMFDQFLSDLAFGWRQKLWDKTRVHLMDRDAFSGDMIMDLFDEYCWEEACKNYGG